MNKPRNPRCLALLSSLFLVALGSFSVPAFAAPVAQPLKYTTPQEAAKLMGRNVYFAVGAAMPSTLQRCMRLEAKQRPQPTGAWYMATMAAAVSFNEDTSKTFHPNLLFVSGSNRDSATQGWSTVHRDSLYSLAHRITKGEFGIDTVVVRGTPPDARGNIWFGPTNDLTMPAIQSALAAGGKVIVEINPNVPRMAGSNFLHVSKVAAMVESNEMLPGFIQMVPTANERAIARNVATLVPNRRRVTLQVGIGSSLVAVGDALKQKRLKIWSEMGSDWVLPVMKGDRPAAREAVFSFLLGTNDLYNFVNDNPRVRMESSLTVNDPNIVAAQKRMVAVNTALEVDLSGNVNAERIGNKIISAPGGQPNFMEGTSRAPDGKAIMALRSINKVGDSTIVAALHGPVVTTPGNAVDYVVTEWGATRRLRGASASARTFELIRIAHPAHRKALADAALAAGTIDQKQHTKLVRSVVHALRLAAVEPELTRMGAELALAKNAITPEQHQQLTANLPPVQNQ